MIENSLRRIGRTDLINILYPKNIVFTKDKEKSNNNKQRSERQRYKTKKDKKRY